MSIRLRLSFWYTGLLALALALFGGFLFFFMNYALHSELDNALNQRAREVTILVASGSARSLDLFAAPDTFVQVVRIDGQAAVVTGRSSNLTANGVQLPVPQTLPGSGRYDTEAVQGESLRIYTYPVVVESQLIGLVQVGRHLAPIDQTLQRLRLLLLSSGLGVLVLAAVFGWWLQGRTLSPIARITAAAEAIGHSGDLSQRVSHEGPDDELGHLATTFNAMLDGLEASRRSQQEAYNAQRRFVADASHELRTPLTIIRGNLNLLERSLSSEAAPDVAEAMADMSAETQRMSALVGDLLTLARADAGVHLERAPLALGPALEEAVHRARRLAADKGVSFSADTAAVAALPVNGSAEHLVRLFSILLDNAVKYTAASGSVRLSARADEGGVRISVTDTGVGIEPQHLPHVFERFYRGGKPQAEGSGLGLAIARWVAEEHGGRINAISAVGQGSSFTVWLPVL